MIEGNDYAIDRFVVDGEYERMPRGFRPLFRRFNILYC